jgi:hypothetical protein
MSDAEGRREAHPARRPSSQVRLLLVTGLLVALAPCLGLLGGGAFVAARQAGAFSRWRSLGAPSETAMNLVTGDIDVIYVRAASGDVYMCRHRGATAARDCWDRAAEPLSVDPEVRFDQQVFGGEVQPPPGRVLDWLYTARWYAEDAFETRYVLLEDGTVWKWEYDVGSYWNLLILLGGALVGVVVAVAVAAVIWAPVLLRSLPGRRR